MFIGGISMPRFAPVLEVESGDKVTLTSVSGGPEVVPKSGFFVPEALHDIHAERSAESSKVIF